MPTVQEDTFSSASYTINSSGISAIRSWRVVFSPAELASSPPAGRLKVALELVGEVRGKEHPYESLLPAADGSAVFEQNDPGIVVVTWRYQVEGGSSPGVIGGERVEIGSTVQSIQTHRDFQGNVITVSYIPVATDANPEPAFDIQGGTVTVQKALTTLTISRRETPTFNSIPILSKSRTFKSTINSVTFQGGGPRTWICAHLDANTTDGGATFDVQYGFIHNPETWDALVVYRGADGKVPGDVDDGRHNTVANPSGASRLVQVYQDLPFAVLGLVGIPQ